MKVVLASQSPRRRELLEQLGVAFSVHVSQADERLTEEEAADPASAACLLAMRKAGVVVQELLATHEQAIKGAAPPASGDTATRMPGDATAAPTDATAVATDAAPALTDAASAPGVIAESTLVIGADTMVVLDGHIFGKPVSASDATGMLRKLSGRTHDVITGVSTWGITPDEGGQVSVGHNTFAEISHVTFRDLSDEEIATYISAGECYDKAGSYAIQGAGGSFVKSYEGSLDNIIGLPAQRLVEMFPDMVPDYHGA